MTSIRSTSVYTLNASLSLRALLVFSGANLELHHLLLPSLCGSLRRFTIIVLLHGAKQLDVASDTVATMCMVGILPAAKTLDHLS